MKKSWNKLIFHKLIITENSRLYFRSAAELYSLSHSSKNKKEKKLDPQATLYSNSTASIAEKQYKNTVGNKLQRKPPCSALYNDCNSFSLTQQDKFLSPMTSDQSAFHTFPSPQGPCLPKLSIIPRAFPAYVHAWCLLPTFTLSYRAVLVISPGPTEATEPCT